MCKSSRCSQPSCATSSTLAPLLTCWLRFESLWTSQPTRCQSLLDATLIFLSTSYVALCLLLSALHTAVSPSNDAHCVPGWCHSMHCCHGCKHSCTPDLAVVSLHSKLPVALLHWLCLQAVDKFLQAKGKLDGNAAPALNDIMEALHSLTTVRANLAAGLSSGESAYLSCSTPSFTV